MQLANPGLGWAGSDQLLAEPRVEQVMRHALDSLVPLFTAGWDEPLPWSAPPPTADVAALCLTALDLVPWCAVGESHATGWA